MHIKIKKDTLKVALLMLPYFTFAVGFKWPLLGLFVQGLRILNLVIILLGIIRRPSALNKVLKSGYIFPMVLLFGTILLSTILNGKDAVNGLQLIICGIVPLLIYMLFIEKKEGSRCILEGTTLVFSILIMFNIIIMLFYREGIYSTYSSGVETKYFLFGAKNQMVAPIMTGMFFFVEYSYRTYNRIVKMPLILCVICAVELLIGGSGTGLLILGLFCVIIIMLQHRKRSVSSNTTIVVVIVATIGIVVFRLQDIFSFIIEGILHKSLTLSNRTYIWDAAFSTLREHWLIGTGVTDSLSGSVFLELSYISKDTFAHNMFLDFMIMGGVISLVAFLWIIWRTKLIYDNSSVVSLRGKTFIWWGIVLYMLASIAEIYSGNYCLFIMFAYISALTEKDNNMNKLHNKIPQTG
ncbi:O-antigen ligase family protein [Robinsoniella peoriensis]|uniref:O-antigen ligase family protein n=1 Tax=Robinsoniella peoriensis TaxID=180332 RepID=UPI003751A033